ncbi:hypothetical protein R3J22_00625 [Trueperella bernardiae]|uniref:hypothetical protein n=1 Tax=Trueperella bernardiae TaxID=59561 RepID=UPI002949FDF4|nr:hypothetical protein [Trueperella bernardiae]MDV6238033.1 hypothetical protein [Trueperella bernardiae]
MMGVAGAIAGSVVARHGLARRLPGWERTNFAERKVSLTGGLETAAGLLAGTLVAALPCPVTGMRAGARQSTATLVATLAAAGAGYIDDHLEDRFPAQGKGFHGHLGALKEGKLTSGLLKIAAIGAGALGAGALTGTHSGEKALDAALIALSANFINLLDLRPGRARKVASLAACAALPATPLAQVSLGAAQAGIREDLLGKKMLGDLGANAIGAHLGVALTALPMRSKCAAVAGLIALTAASEKVSFSAVIENTPVLREFDNLGRA